MAVVVEVLTRSGQVLRHQVFDQQELSIGRAYTNDFVIADTHVDPSHMHIACLKESGEFDCFDLDSVNGVTIGKRARDEKINQVAKLPSGSQLLLGKTILRIGFVNDQWAPAVPLSLWEGFADSISRWWLVLVMALLFVAAHTLDAYLDNPLAKNKASHYINVVYILVGAVFFASFYTFLAKIFRHDTRFTLYFNMILCGLLVVYSYAFIEPVLMTNIVSTSIKAVVDYIFVAVFLWFFVYALLRYATHLKRIPRVLIALILPLVIVLAEAPKLFDSNDRFLARPPYDPIVVNQDWYWHSLTSQPVFLDNTNELYQQKLDD